ncbi:hypothetical protein Acr_01g0007780 [Actinidia rufa]|uniref:Reverse transcriptase zinc-binding domain-containing protein n=1 Tax=Actinidia rufa TaxID=165716 RepID=A0A7J0E4U4_9ERIC|nr:hypothetical protein Acr_01g0007780 [Actinidia rufa]
MEFGSYVKGPMEPSVREGFAVDAMGESCLYERYPFWEYIPTKQDSQMVRHLALIRDKIVAVEGSPQTALDSLYHWAAQGSFNVKACYDFFRTKGANPCWTKIGWHRALMPKHSFILWLSLKEKLLTRDRIAEHIEDTSCALCGYTMESLDHLFFRCPTVSQVWVEVKAWLGFTRALNTLKAAVKWTIKDAQGTGVQAIAKRMGIACTVYCIWKHTEILEYLKGKFLIPLASSETLKCKSIDPFMGFSLTSRSCELLERERNLEWEESV